MNVPLEYAQWLKSLSFNEVSFGYTGLKLFLPDELEEGQVGYARSPEGKTLCDGVTGSWKPEWTVIGYETLGGDPIIMDTSSPEFQVMTAMHGEGSWDPYPIASSLQAFAAALQVIHECSAGRENPAALEEKPISAEERSQALEKIQAANNGEVNLEFWQLILESGLP